ncbi:MAG TPA: efflux RND transporter permease subunit [Ignavibacteriales bacterium]|nr:efflux RND transporter permease subunit [Ignavibacteriales bacterium]
MSGNKRSPDSGEEFRFKGNLSINAIKRPASVIIMMVAVVVVGILGYSRLATNLLPDITYPFIKVYINWNGATPEEIEDNIATVVERKMSTVDNLDYLDSQCTEGLYTLLIYFDYKADRDVAYQDVLAKLGMVRKQLPKDADEPLIMKADPSQLPVIDLLVTSEAMDLTKLRTYVENQLQDQFTSVEGTAGTEVSGGLKREIRVLLNPLKLQAYGITPDKVAQRLKDENIELQAGRITSAQKDYIARTLGEFSSVFDIQNLIISKAQNGSVVYLKDIADISDASAVQRLKTKMNSGEGVKLSVFKQAAANSVEVSENIHQRLTELKASLPASINMEVIYDQADYIRSAVSGVRDAALIAAILVVIVTGLFLSGWRRVLIVSLTLPVTLLGTFFFMKLLNFSINIFSLGGLVVAITVLLDDAVIVLENITRIQEEEPLEKHPVQKGVTQVLKAVTMATFTFAALFLPFLLVPGMASLLFRELIIIIAITILLSRTVSQTITPSLTALLFPEGKPVAVKKGFISKRVDDLMNRIISVYKPFLKHSLKLRWVVMILTGVLFIIGIYFLKNVGSEFLPKADDGSIMVKVKMPTGASMEQTDKAVQEIEEVIKDQPGIEKYSSLSGGRVWGLVTYENANEGEVDIQLVPPSKRNMNTDAFVQRLAPLVQQKVKFPGAKIKVAHTKMKGIPMIGDYDIEVEVIAPRSESMENIYENAANVAGILKNTKGLTGVDVSIDITKPEYQIFVNRQKAIDLGFNVNQVAANVKSMVDGVVPTQYQEKGYYYPVRVVVNEKNIKSKKDLEDLIFISPNGGNLNLSNIAEVVQQTGPLEIDRRNQNRIIKATANVSGVSIGEATNIIKEKLKNRSLPSGYTIHFGGQSQMLAENFKSMIMILIMAMFFAYVILVINFESFLKPLMILIRVPLSLIGVSSALYLTNQPIGVTVLIGFIILAGIEINQGVLLITFIDELRSQGMNLLDAIQNASVIRLRPIIMTDIVGIIGLLPLALSIGEGTELLKPMAIAVIGGLIFGLILVFSFLPALYYIFEKSRGSKA